MCEDLFDYKDLCEKLARTDYDLSNSNCIDWLLSAGVSSLSRDCSISISNFLWYHSHPLPTRRRVSLSLPPPRERVRTQVSKWIFSFYRIGLHPIKKKILYDR